MTISSDKQRIAVIGSGISGLASAYFLQRKHEVVLFEAGTYLGGHSNTVDIVVEGQKLAVDTGFLVFNERTYPNLIALLAELGVPSFASDMTFAVSMDEGRLEWAGTNLDTVFAQRRNLLSPAFLRMVRDILHFNSRAEENLQRLQQTPQLTLGQLLAAGGYGDYVRDAYLLPMAAAIWSSSPQDILQFPAATFLRFCQNHALLQINDRPQWRTIQGGSRNYVQKIAATLPHKHLQCAVHAVRRTERGVIVSSARGEEEFDAVVLATHAPDSLRLLQDADQAERSLLSAQRYQENAAVLHTDPGQLPQRRKLWSAWNYLGRQDVGGERSVCVSYWLNRLQNLPVQTPVVVTLNPFQEPDPAKVLARFSYAHPIFDQAAIAAQAQLPGIQGRRKTWFAGAWSGYGFHEDGLKSALRVVKDFGLAPAWTSL